MMMTFILAFGIFALSALCLAVGVLVGRGPVTGSCGGSQVIDACPICERRHDP